MSIFHRPIPSLKLPLITGAFLAAHLFLSACGSAEPEEKPPEEVDGAACISMPEHPWRAAPSLPTISEGALMSVWGFAPNQVYAVGGQPDRGAAWRFDGNSWAPLEVPEGPMLNWVHGAGETLFFVGNQGRALRLREGEFETLETGTREDLWGVWAADDAQVWAVGGNARDFDAEPVLLHFDGQRWESIPLPELDRPTNALFKVWGLSSRQIFAVGAIGTILGFDGEEWKQMPSGASDDFVSLWGRAPDEIVAVGGRSNGMIARFDGERWESEIIAGLPGFNGVWMDCTGTAHINGLNGVTLRLAPRSWDYTREITPTGRVLHGIFGFDGGPRFGVGGTLDSSPPYQGVLLEAGEE